jgi:hypothetical protein
MHIHGNSMSVNQADFYSAAQGERTTAAQRAAEVRKKLLSGSSATESASSPEEALLIGHWLDSRHSQTQSEEQYHSSAAGKDPDLG